MAAELLRAEGRTDVHDQANSRFSQFCERAWKKGRESSRPKMESIMSLNQIQAFMCSKLNFKSLYRPTNKKIYEKLWTEIMNGSYFYLKLLNYMNIYVYIFIYTFLCLEWRSG